MNSPAKQAIRIMSPTFSLSSASIIRGLAWLNLRCGFCLSFVFLYKLEFHDLDDGVSRGHESGGEHRPEDGTKPINIFFNFG